jgi:hypothetical protein
LRKTSQSLLSRSHLPCVVSKYKQKKVRRFWWTKQSPCAPCLFEVWVVVINPLTERARQEDYLRPRFAAFLADFLAPALRPPLAGLLAPPHAISLTSFLFPVSLRVCCSSLPQHHGRKLRLCP